MDVEITWEYPGGDTTMLPTVIDYGGRRQPCAIYVPDNTPFRRRNACLVPFWRQQVEFVQATGHIQR